MDLGQGSSIVFVGEEKEDVYDFDVKKANRIFDLLLEKKQLRIKGEEILQVP